MGGVGGGHGDLQTFGGQNRCWKCAKKRCKLQEKLLLAHVLRGCIRVKQTRFSCMGAQCLNFWCICCMQPLGCVMWKKHCKYREKIAFGAM